VAEDSAESDRTVLDLYQLDKKVREEGNLEYFEGTCLIKSNRRTVVIKKTTDQRLLMKEIQAQLIFYENEYDFGKRCLNKMRDYFCLRGEYYVVYDKGGEMISYLDNNRKITDIQLLQMASDLSKALGSLHALGLVHAKLNPDSVSFTYDSVANTFSLLLTDFDRSYFEPSSAMSIGSGKAPKIEVDSCSSPELIFGGLVADRKSDYWSAGCLLFFIATGKQMFPSNSKSGLAYMIDKLNLDGSNMLKKLHPMAAQYIDKMSEEHKLDFDDSLLAVRELLRDLQVARSQTYQIIVDCLRISPQER
jgi:serine/threonine protein kinase